MQDRSRLRRRALVTGAALGVLLVPPTAPADVEAGAGGAGTEEVSVSACLIEPQMVVDLSSAVEGQIEVVLVDRGDFVKKGQVVARLESGVERASASLAAERLEYERRRARRGEQMFQRNAISQQQLDEARSELRVRELELDRSQGVVERRLIRSPIEGVVVKRHLDPGEFAEPSEVLEIAQIDPLRVECYAPADLFGRIRAGDRARVLTESEAIGRVAARVTVVDPMVDSSSGTFGVRLEMPNAKRRIPAGLRSRVEFALPPAPAAPSP